ncbi:uncharacterized protein LOC111021288 [Momordica charantia]|uniref:Uncharacterized protein LOC111021288 n=1 Tax=Momordica charantia TaxID=3673 RepID=A0A6J1DM00_MOMCH|nr:uncharacterized protein LOC111021288 [Momordica charantia]
MAEPLRGGGHDLEQSLKPFFQRASEAEDRLSRLEATLLSKKDTWDEEHLKTIAELQSKLDSANEALIAERKKAEIVAAENAKLQYRIIHLVRTAREAHQKLEQI